MGAALLLALLLAVLAQPAAMQPPGIMGAPPVEVEAENVTYVVLVHPDGTVEPRYAASGRIVLAPGLNVTGELVAVYSAEAGGRAARGEGTLEASFEVGGPLNVSRSSLTLEASWRLGLEGGRYSAALAVVAQAVSGGEAGGAYLLASVSGDADEARVALEVRARPYQGALPARDQLEKALRTAGVDFVRLLRYSAGVVDDQAYLELEAAVDMRGAAEYLRAKRVPADVAEAPRELLAENVTYSAEASLRLRAVVEPAPGRGLRATVAANYTFSAQGDVERFGRLAAEYGPRIAAYIVSLLALLAADVASALGDRQAAAQLSMMAVAAYTAAGDQPALYPRPPYSSSLEVRVELEGGEGRFSVELRGERLAYLYPTGDPARDARLALGELRDYVSALAEAAMMLGANLPGLHTLVPEYAEVAPASPEVSVEPTRVPLGRLGRVTVTVLPAEAVATPTPAPEATTPAPPTPTRTPAPAEAPATEPAATATEAETPEAATTPAASPAPAEVGETAPTEAPQRPAPAELLPYVAVALAVAALAAALLAARRR